MYIIILLLLFNIYTHTHVCMLAALCMYVCAQVCVGGGVV